MRLDQLYFSSSRMKPGYALLTQRTPARQETFPRSSWEGLLPGRCSLGEQCIPSLHPTTAKVKRTEEINSVVMVRAAMKVDQ